MECRFDSTGGAIGVSYESAVVIAILSASLLLSGIGYYDDFSAGVTVSAIIFAVSVAAAVILHNIKSGVIYVKSDELVIVHSFAAREVLVSRISYEDIEYADHNVTQKRSRIGFYCYVFELYIHIKSGQKIKLCIDLDISENMPTSDPDGYKRYINDQPIMKICRYINERKNT